MIISLEVVTVFVLRAGLVALFMPFSVYYMIAHFRRARAHAATAGVGLSTATAMTFAAIALKAVASIGVLTGIADRLCTVMLAIFCLATAFLYKKFWTGGGLRFSVEDRNVPRFWEFMKNVSLAAGLVLIGFGADAETFRHAVAEFIDAPFASSNPYGIEVSQ